MRIKTIFTVSIVLLFPMLNAQEFSVERSEQFANRRMTEIKKLVSLTSGQEALLNAKCIEYQLQLDSALYFEPDPLAYADKINDAEKEFTQFFFSCINDRQIAEYVRIKGNADVRRKTDDRIGLLRESGDYSEAELAKIEEQVFNYLMLEKVVYMRDKHDVAKQKENIHRLKALQPPYVKAAESQRKLKHDGRVQNGRVKWNR